VRRKAIFIKLSILPTILFIFLRIDSDEGALLEKLVERLLKLGKNNHGVDEARRA